MKTRKYRIALLAAFAVSLVFFLFRMNLLPGISGRAARPKGFELLSTLLDYIRHDYLEERDPLRTADGAYRGLVNSLDALSSYLDKGLTSRHLAQTAKTTQPGLVIFKRYADFPQVFGVIPGSPAEKSGLRAGDVLSVIEGRNTLNMSLVEANLYLKGTDERPVRLKVLRREETLEMTVARTAVFSPPYSLTREPGRPAVLTVRKLSPAISAVLKKDVLPGLVKDAKAPLVIDLRNSFEGDFEEARAFVNLFLKAPAIGHFEKRGGVRTLLACPAPAPAAGLPLVVWVGPATMGPAELVAGVLQELKKAPVVGLPTMGLVAERDFHSLKDGSSVLLTSKVFVLPSGRTLWEQGVRPDESLAGVDLGDKAYFEKTLPLLSKL